jgi:hypothetical protein
MISTFLNPFGYDILVYKLTSLTKDYWSTMYVLYGLAFLSFSFAYAFFKLNKRKIGNYLITLALFLNPFGYDVVVYGILLLTKSYWFTMSIMYSLTILFFGLFIYFSDVNLLVHAKKAKTKIKNKIIKNG